MTDVTAAIIRNNEKILIARRAQGEKHAGFWEFPGGKLEAGETPEECLKRELFEEFGIDTKNQGFVTESIYEYPAGIIRLLAYSTGIVSGEIKLNVHDSIEWVHIQNLQQYKLLPADVPIAKHLMEELK